MAVENFSYEATNLSVQSPQAQYLQEYNNGMAAATGRFEVMILAMFAANIGLILLSRIMKQEIEVPYLGRYTWELPLEKNQMERLENILFTVQYSINSVMVALVFFPMYTW